MKRALLATALASSSLLTQSAYAQTGPGLMLVPWMHEDPVELKADAFYTDTEANITGADVGLSIFDVTGRVRLKPDASYNPTIGFAFTQFDINSSDAALPDRLYDTSIAFGGSFGDVDLGESIGNWQMGYNIGLGYAGTAPFNDGDAWYGKADLFAVKAFDRDTRWVVGINYDGNRTFLPDVPLPAVTYFARLNEEMTYALGFPYSQLTWKPDDKWTLDVRSAVFFSFNARASYKATDDLELFASYTRRSDAFTVSGGLDNRRLLFSQQRAELGLAYAINERVALTVAGGYAFAQEFDVGYDSRDPTGLRDLDDSAFIRAGVELRF